MTQLERDELVERYLSGAMGAGEAEEFQARTAADPELQQTLKAQEILRTAIRNEVEHDVPERASYHTAVLGLLAATPAAVGTVTGGGATAAGTASTAGAVAGIGVGKIVVGVLLAGALTLGTVMIVNVKKESGVAPPMSPQTPQVKQSAPITPAEPPTLGPASQQPSISPAPSTTGAPRESVNAARAQQNNKFKAQGLETPSANQTEPKSTDRVKNTRSVLPPENHSGSGDVKVEQGK